MADLKNHSVKMTDEQYDRLLKKAGELDVSRSDILRAASDFWLDQLDKNPWLMQSDAKRLQKISSLVSVIIETLENY